ncbi:Pyruvate/Phosphoenolpyruvate kinase-like domain containing protein [Trema orientale]|uniref:Pyruvate/Phosphoenolpyruvate kinase-like domain containing protein n=1 Tax=Trema orientale TaxID=63057 RepID=A0A2P5FCQ5_TREOI|nr:Pyruvate/Phosphoenolpyruvate kinase-like domain containing protein [Trema orientale]
MRIKAASDARRESESNIVIVARTDSRQVISFGESLRSAMAFADAGADVIFIDALTSKEEMKEFCEIAPLVPKLANMLEGGSKTPILSPSELENIGYKLVLYPLSLLGASIRAMQDALMAIKGGQIPPPGCRPCFEEIKEILGFNTYYEEEKRYANRSQLSSQKVSPSPYGVKQWVRDKAERKERTSECPMVEVDMYAICGADVSREPLPAILSQKFLLKITDSCEVEHLHQELCAGELEGIHNAIPALGGLDIKELLDGANNQVGGTLLLDVKDALGDRIQIFLE